MALSLANLITSAREAAYDRFPTPVLYVRKIDKPLWKLRVSGTQIKVVDTQPTMPVDKFVQETVLDITFEQLYESLVLDDDNLSVAALFSYKPKAVVKDLVPTNTSIGIMAPISRKYFFSDEEIKALFTLYLMRYNMAHCSCLPTDAELQAQLDKINCAKENHVIWWLAFYMIEARRAAELAGNSLEITFTNDESAFCGNVTGSPVLNKQLGSVTASVGDVFSISLDDNAGLNNTEDLSLPGANNIFGDDGFWWRMQNYVREQLERTYMDYSLRPNQVIQSDIILEKSYNVNAYFDSFPYEIWSYPRKVLAQCGQ